MIFQHTWEKVLSGEKTQTRRIVKPGDGFTTPLSLGVIGKDAGRMITTVPNYSTPRPGFNNIYSVCNGKRTVYQVNKDYAVQPGRTKSGVARIQLTEIRREDVRNISDEDVAAEGFGIDKDDFLEVWCQMHDPGVLPYYTAMYRRGWLESQPSERYQAWALTFRLVE